MQHNDIDSKYTEWLRENNESATLSEFIQRNFFLSEHDLEKLEKETEAKGKRKRKKKK